MGVLNDAEAVASAAWSTAPSTSTRRTQLEADLTYAVSRLRAHTRTVLTLRAYYPQFYDVDLNDAFPHVGARLRLLQQREQQAIQWLIVEYGEDKGALLLALNRAYAPGGTG